MKLWTNFTSHRACQEVYYMPLARYQTGDSRGMTEGILTILHLGNKFCARRKSSVTHAIWYPLPSFYEQGEKRGEEEPVSSDTGQTQYQQKERSSSDGAFLFQLHRCSTGTSTSLSINLSFQIYIRKPIIISGASSGPFIEENGV